MTIGIDCGSLTVKGVRLDARGRVSEREVRRHHGEVDATVREVLSALLGGRAPTGVRLSLTGRHGAALAARLGVEAVDPVAAEMAGARAMFGAVDHVLHLGGSSLLLISLDPEGHLLSFHTNTACAAGTGSFLDEQAARMGLDEDAARAIQPVANPPSVATRCAVFAKTDLIHRQQEGFGRDQLWCGLCHGMSRTAVQTLLKGHDLQGEVALTGGVASNPGMVHYLREALGRDVRVSDDSAVCGALGAALEGTGIPAAEALERLAAPVTQDGTPAAVAHRPALALRRSKFPDFSVHTQWTDDEGNEVRVHRLPARGETWHVILGIDVGSTSTKAAACDAQGAVLVDVYRRTQGDPVTAGKKLLGALADVEARLGITLDIQAVGTTGSGRKIVGAIAGADLVVNEISAHVRGAVSVDPDLTTILEIGGQDSKYMRIQDGRIVDANMNYVCAAGTGTFVEELGRKLGFAVEEIGNEALGSEAPSTSDRCTVFMEQDAADLVRRGVPRHEVMAAILYSVIENYRTKVVGNRPVGPKRVMFQGATARNPGLVAAVEGVFGVEVVVSPYCHVMGAIGAALLAREELAKAGRPSAFRGLGLASRDIRVTTDTCRLCTNHCVISTAEVEGADDHPSFGYLCGREPEARTMRRNAEYSPFRARKAAVPGKATRGESGRPRIGVPLALGSWGYAPLFRALIENLGGEAVFSPETDRETARVGASKVGSDFCFPVKVAHGHVAKLLDREDLAAIFVPAMLEEQKNPHTSRARFCPYVCAFPSVVRPLFLDTPLGPTLVNPVLDWNVSALETGRQIAVAFAGVLDVSPEEGMRAWEAARATQEAHAEALVAKGREVLAGLKRDGKKGIVIIGRPYTTLDPTVSLNLPLKISEAGFTVIPMDFLPFRPELLGPAFYNVYWNYGQRILSALAQVAQDPDLAAIWLTSFNCGPDSFLLTFGEELMGTKPMLVLELDEHGSDGGYATRIEAFLDVVRSRGAAGKPRVLTPAGARPEELRGRTLWIPPMHPLTTRLFAAVFRGVGIDSRALPDTGPEALALGRAASRGSECTPMAMTLGGFLKRMRDDDLDPAKQAFFMPDATGPCRFGSYALAQHIALEHLGMGSVPIFSPSSDNAYLGIPMSARKAIWDAVLCGDFLFKLGLRVRPYENRKGATDRAIEAAMVRLEQAFERRRDPKPELGRAAREILAIPRVDRDKPLVGVVGEIYVRCDPFGNAFVIREVEANGGEAWLAPISEWILYTVWVERNHGKMRGDSFLTRLVSEFSNIFIEDKEHAYEELMRPYLADRLEPRVEDVLDLGFRYLDPEFEGEAPLTVGRAVKFFEDGADLVVNVAPFGCMHGHLSGSLFERVARTYGRPIVTSFYDAGSGNGQLRSFVEAAARRRAEERPERVRL